jgi:hypothetical protein
MPSTLSIISTTFPPKERGAALGIWAGTSGMVSRRRGPGRFTHPCVLLTRWPCVQALALGPLLGGVLTEKAKWTWVFFINLPVGVIGVIAAYVFAAESRDEHASHKPDFAGLFTSGSALFCLGFGLIEVRAGHAPPAASPFATVTSTRPAQANSYGWSSDVIVSMFAVFFGLSVAFVLVELRVEDPLFDVRLLQNLTFLGALISGLLISLGMFGVFFFLSLFMQNILKYTAIQTGAAFLPRTHARDAQ